LIDFVLHIDSHIASLFELYGSFTYAILFIIIFCETGLIVTPFLPGDSLLFSVGALMAFAGAQGVTQVAILLSVAAIAGDATNYAIGVRMGPAFFTKKKTFFFNPDHLQKAHAFYERHGGKTIILARFMPILRTFAPFVAGMGRMTYRRFALYNVAGGVAWVVLFLFAGYFFGAVPMIKKNFTLVILTIIVLSLLPGLLAFFRRKT
jgi:membrane-associated protein